MFGFGKGNRDVLPIGLDLGYSAAKLAQLRDTKDGLELACHAYVEIPSHLRQDPLARLDFLAQTFPRQLRAGGFKGTRCVMGLPPETTFVRHIKLPRLDADGTASEVRKAAQKDMPYSAREAVIRHIVAGEVYAEGETRQEVIVVASPLSTVDAYLAMATRIGLEVVGVNIEPVALVECFSSLFQWAQDPERPVMYVDLGSQNTQVAIAHGSDLVFARNMTRGSQQLEKAIAEKLGCSDIEARDARMALVAGHESPLTQDALDEAMRGWLAAMVQEFETCLRYYTSSFRRSGVDRVIFTGGQARDKRLCQALAQRLNLPAQVGDPLMGIRCPVLNPSGNGDHDPHPGLAVGIGLSFSGRT